MTAFAVEVDAAARASGFSGVVRVDRAADMIDDVVVAANEFGPDVVLFESLAFAGPLAADLLGVPGVHHLFGPVLPHEVFVLANDAVSPIWRSFGRDVPGYAGVYRT